MYIIYSRLIICHLGNLWGLLIIIFQLSALGNYLEFEMHSNARLALIGNELLVEVGKTSIYLIVDY